MPSPRAVRWEQKEGKMNKCHFSLKEFWDRCMEPVYDLETGRRFPEIANILKQMRIQIARENFSWADRCKNATE